MRKMLIAAAAMLVLTLTAAPAAEAQSCNGTVVADLFKKQELDNTIEWRFAVEVASDAGDCAYVHFDFIAEEILPDGQKRTIRRPMHQKVRSSTEKARLVKHRVNKGTQLVRWEFKYTSCRLCDEAR